MGNNDAVAPPGNNHEEHRLIRSLSESVLLLSRSRDGEIHSWRRQKSSQSNNMKVKY